MDYGSGGFNGLRKFGNLGTWQDPIGRRKLLRHFSARNNLTVAGNPGWTNWLGLELGGGGNQFDGVFIN